MADTPLKTVRARKIIRGKSGSTSIEPKGEFDLKVSLYKDGVFNRKREVRVTDSSGNKVPGKEPIEYSTNGRYSNYEDIDYIRDYLDTQAKLQDGSATTKINGQEFPIWQILQDPWQDKAPTVRDFGYDPYYFNNGVKVEIFWFYQDNQIIGTQTNHFSGKVEPKTKQVYLPDGGTQWSKKPPSGWVGAFDIYDIEVEEIIRGTYSEFGGAFIKDKIITKNDILKTVKLTMPDGSVYGIGRIPESERTLRYGKEYDELGIVKYDSLKRYETIDGNNYTEGVEWARFGYEDWMVLDQVKELYCFQLERNKFVKSKYEYELELCKPEYDNCKLIEFKDPLTGDVIAKEPDKKEPESIKPTDGSKSNSTGTKIKLNFSIPADFKISANKDVPVFQVFVGDIPQTTSSIYEQEEYVSEEDILDEEFIEFNYNEPNPNAPNEIEDPNDPKRGSPDAEKDSTASNINQSNESTTSTSTTTTTTKAPGQVKTSDPTKVKEALAEATQSTGPGPGGKCARFTFNHANNFIRILLGKEPQGAKNAAGGNANQEGYHSALEKVGYKRTDQGTLSKKDIISYLNNKDNWNVGDVVAYWGVDAPSSEFKNGGVQYGHTQIFTDGAHGTNHLWTSDDVGNFKCNFVYGKYQTDKWRFIIFKSPHTTDDGKKKLGLA